jgi:hypothetical protein
MNICTSVLDIGKRIDSDRKCLQDRGRAALQRRVSELKNAGLQPHRRTAGILITCGWAPRTRATYD